MLTLKEYDDIVAKILLSPRYSSTGKKIVNDPDAFGEIVTEVMLSDLKWREDKNTSRWTFRYKKVVWGINKYLTKIKAKKNFIQISQLEKEDENNESIGLEIGISGDYSEIDNEEILKICMPVLSERERQIIRKRFYENSTISSIGKKYNISGTRVKQILDSSYRKMRRQLRNEKSCYI